MSRTEIVMAFPISKTTVDDERGLVWVDTGLTAEELLLAVMKSDGIEDRKALMVKKKKEGEE